MQKISAKRVALSALIGTLLTAALFYIWLPAINGFDPSFWIFLLFVSAFYFVPYFIIGSGQRISGIFKNIGKKTNAPKAKMSLSVKIFIGIACTIAGVLVLGSLISSTVFNARRYASIITVTEAEFSKDMQESKEVTNIALMDSDSAQRIGNRTLSSLSDVVSQFVAGERYTQINYHGLPKKVTSLEYADFFKWMNNRGVGVPGYIMVDPVNNNAEYVKLAKPIKYVDSGYFGDDLYRKLRFEYPTKIFDYISYEVNEEGKPYYIVSCVKPKIFPFGGYDVSEVIIFDPCTGESTLYSINNTPSWIDTAFSGDLAVEKYDWYGTLSGGFINSIIGNKGCKITTDDYGYVTIGDDVWYYTGVTSVTADSSNIGFILTNARTGEYKYYSVGGAEEHTAMQAAEGEVADMGYTASFPSLVNIAGEATYIMVLKDDSGIVKLYALVNVEDYTVGIATGKTQVEVMKAYKARLREEGIISGGAESDDTPTAEFKINVIKNAVIAGESIVYLKDGDGNIYRGEVSEHEMLIWLSEGDSVRIEYGETKLESGDVIRNILSFEKVG